MHQNLTNSSSHAQLWPQAWLLFQLLEEGQGGPRIHWLQVIYLCEDCYNLLLGSTYQKSLHAAEDLNVLHEGNYGSRPYRSSLNPIGIETKYGYLTWLTQLKFSNDADSCMTKSLST
jgi:hypothetical protein